MKNGPRIRIVFVLTALTLGGAEMMLWKLLSRIDRRRFEPHVIALSAQADDMCDRFRAIDVPCQLLGMTPRLDASWRVARLAGALRRIRPHIVQGWLYHGNVAATLAAALTRIRAPVLWNIRGTLPSRAEKNWRSTLVIKASGLLSSTPALIINNSLASALEHEAELRYPPEKRVVLVNGFDTNLFRPSGEDRAAVRAELNVAEDAIVIGVVGRYHPMKDHAGFLRAAAILRETHPDAQFVLVGARVDWDNPAVSELVSRLGLARNVHLLGRRHDLARLTAAFDIACSSSAYGEGFANVVGEAMSCAVPCVVTDVGDSARIVDDTGRAVPPCDPPALATAMRELVEAGCDARIALGERARERVCRHFSIEAVVGQYEDLYARVLSEHVLRLVPAGAITTHQR